MLLLLAGKRTAPGERYGPAAAAEEPTPNTPPRRLDHLYQTLLLLAGGQLLLQLHSAVGNIRETVFAGHHEFLAVDAICASVESV